MEVTMNANQLLKHRHATAVCFAPSTSGLIGKLHRAARAAAAATIIGLFAVNTAYADPATGTPKVVELAGYEVPARGYQCLPMFRGKYTGWRCEYQSAEATGKTIAKTP
jgi:hypothetical protein